MVKALVRKKKCSQADYSTVFYYNLFVGAIFYIILYFTSGAISNFFHEPKLKLIIQVLSLSLIIKSFSLIHSIILIKHIDFKLQTKITIVASLSSGLIGIFMALTGYGVWSLVIKTLSGLVITTILFWYWSSWKPSFSFSIVSFKELFSFGSKLLLTGLLSKVYNNIYLLIIGKYFSASELGYYTRADQFKNLPTQNLSVVIQRVSYPALSSLQDEIPRLKDAYKKVIKSTMLLTFFLVFGLAAISKPLIITLIGDKWLPSVVYLQLLCLVGIFFPLQAINQNLLKVQGQSSTILKLEFIKKILAVPVIIGGVIGGIKLMIVGMILLSFISFLMDGYFSGKRINYSLKEQLKDIFSPFIISAFAGSIVYLLGVFLNTPEIVTLLIQAIVFLFISILSFEIFRIAEYIFIKQIIFEKLHSFNNSGNIK